MTKESPDERFLRFVEWLEHLQVVHPDRMTKEMRWLAKQSRAYLDGKYETIDAALGLEEK